MNIRSGLCVILLMLLGATQTRADALDTALNDAIAAFERARPALSTETFGVDVPAYGDALILGQFSSAYWGGIVALALEHPRKAGGSCARFAAYVQVPPQNGVVTFVTCPQFRTEGTNALRRLTVLHEMVHIVAGSDECRAMAFAAKVEMLATGSFTPVERYWRANDCDASPYSLP
ncbi:hypothetical protein [Devosia sp. CAU 1758]